MDVLVFVLFCAIQAEFVAYHAVLSYYGIAYSMNDVYTIIYFQIPFHVMSL